MKQFKNKTCWNEFRPDKFEYNGTWIRNWFSNFILSVIVIDNILYNSVENFYQAMKSISRNDHIYVAKLTPSQAKKWGRTFPEIRDDWEQVKYDFMKQALLAKFSIPIWKEKLLATGDEVLIEWNNWGDRIWGVAVVDNMGKNLLGIALMEVREQLRLEGQHKSIPVDELSNEDKGMYLLGQEPREEANAINP